jgi:glycosyltransferase involved in cell wall biosynthesis
MKIAHITSDIDGRRNSGTARVAAELIVELSRRVEVHQTFIHFSPSHEDIYKLSNTNEIIIPLGKNWLSKRRSISFIKFFMNNQNRKKYGNFDVVHWHSSRLLPLFFLIPAKKVIVTLHDAGHRLLPETNTFATRIHYWNLRFFLYKIDKVIAVSRMAMVQINRYGHIPLKKLAFIYNGSNFGNMNPVGISDFVEPERFIICISRWQKHKNVESLIVAISFLKEYFRQTDTKLILVGKPVNNYNLPEKLISKYQLEDLVIILSNLSDENLAFLYDRALLNVNPSLHEGFGLSVLEGMSRGCPSIVHKSTATSEVCGESGIHVEMKDSQILAEAIMQALNNADSLKKLKTLSKQRAAQFTWENAACKLMKIYLE